MAAKKKVAVGIDLGTTYSCVAVWQNDQVEIIANDQGNRTTPSYVAFTENERLVGEAAYNQCSRNPANTIFDAKRLIGRRFSDEVVQEDSKLWPFKVVQGVGDKPMIEATLMGETKRFTAEEISSMVLSKMKQVASDYLGEEVTEAVITVPAYFNDSQRQATKDAGTIAGLNVLRIINEPTAAAIAYGLDKEGSRDVLLFDFGGGTLDVSIVHIEDGMFEVKSSHGDTHLGGEDLDNLLVDHFQREFKNKQRQDISQDQRALRRLRTACERAKRTLSSSTQANVEVEALANGVDFHSKITRARFNDLCSHVFNKCMRPIDDALKDADLKKEQIDEIVLVGGSTRIPRIQEMIRDYFGKEPCKSINPDEAVAYGAAIQAAILTGTATGKAKEALLLDVTPISVGVESAGGKMAVIVPRNTTIPTKGTKMFSTNRDNQTSVKVQVYEGERPLTQNNHFLGTFTLDNIPPQPRAKPRIEVTFDIDANGILTVTALEKESNRQATITISNDSGRLTQEQIDGALKEAEKFAQRDRETAELLDWTNTLENKAFNTLNRISEEGFGGEATSQEKDELRKAADAALNWLSTPEAKELAKVKEHTKVFEAVYSRIAPAVQKRLTNKELAAAEEEAKRKREEAAAAGAQDGQNADEPHQG
eukprot:CAMPEP_0174233232 /NCGR_PEP_ID=MMETSP0417-20130205/3321_1 /TAXON_ID=242541 /ORGANISM="Mayorella sp, Strain BSH-02190019" /LENGTH=650 /DNA_ID=CAMNT_0015311405 /DNA_START=139 /DNA_END=2091 /DNA_ORIENTATION=+